MVYRIGVFRVVQVVFKQEFVFCVDRPSFCYLRRFLIHAGLRGCCKGVSACFDRRISPEKRARESLERESLELGN